MSFTVLDAAGNTNTVTSFTTANATAQLMQSVPSLVSGSAMIGSANIANSLPISIATDQRLTAVVSGTVAVTGSTTSLNLVQVGGSAIGLGQVTMASSVPVVLASNQSNLTAVLGAALPAGANAIGTVSALQSGGWTVSVNALPAGTNAIGTVTVLNAVSVSGTLPMNLTAVGGAVFVLGSTSMSKSLPVVIATDQVQTVAISGTPPINLTAVGGAALNLGAQGSAASLPVVIATNQNAIPISGTITATNPSVSTTNTTTPAQATLLGVGVNSSMQAVSGVAINATTFAMDVNIASSNISITATNPSVATTNQTTPAQASLIGVGVNSSMQAVSGVAVNATTFAMDVNIATSNISITATNPSSSTTGIAAPAQATLNGLTLSNATMQAWSGLNPAGAPNATTFAGRMDLLSVAGTTIALGSQGSAASLPVVIATNQGNLTTVLGAALPAGSNAIGTVSITGTPSVNLTTVGGSVISLGAAASAASIPVVIATNQSAIPVSGTVTASNPSVGTTNATVPTQATLNGIVLTNGSMQAWAGINPSGAANATVFAGRMDLLSVAGTTITLGAQGSAVSIPVVLATNMAALTAVVSGTVSITGGTFNIASATLTGVVSTSGTPAAIAVKSASGAIYAIDFASTNTALASYVKLYNITAAGVSSATAPFWILAVPPGAVHSPAFPSGGVNMGGTGISYIITRNATANDTTAVNAYDVVGSLAYI